MRIRKIDRENKFISWFDTETGRYIRTGIIDSTGKDTGVDPFMTSFPELIDVGIMQTCVCAHRCNVDCYQKAIERTGSNMSLEDFASIVEQCKGKTFQFALGGAGDVDTHENFEEILKICRDNNIVPNFTTSGIMMTQEKAALCKKYCGAVAVSEHHAEYTNRAVQMLLDAGVSTSIHYVLGNNSIEEATRRLKENDFPEGINAVIFLLYKPVGLGRIENVLVPNDPKVKEFFNVIDNGEFNFKIGFDSCTIPGLLNNTSKIMKESMDTCEGGRWSCYITADMKMLPCSFDNQELKWAVDLNSHSIKEAWDSDKFEDFRNHFRYSCPTCKNKAECMGGCPIRREIVLCDKEEKDLVM